VSPLALSFEVAVLATLLSALVGLSVAALLATTRFPGRDVVDVLFTAPLVMPPTVLGYYVLVALGQSSVVGRAFHALTGSTIVFTKVGAVVAATLGALPIVVKSGRAAIEEVDSTLVFAARTLGATRLRALLTVQFPLALRGIVAALMVAFARALGDFGVTLMVAGNIPGETRTEALAIYDALQAHRDEEARTGVLVLTLSVVALLYVVGKIVAKPRES
jgi:molybdate transport system permease protein